MLKQNFILVSTVFFLVMIAVIPTFVYGEETVEIEFKYTNSDRADITGLSIIVFQGSDQTSIIEKEIKSNSDFITVPKNDQYQIDVYNYGLYLDTAFIKVNESSKKFIITLPLSAGLQFDVVYKDGVTPFKGATVVLKSFKNYELGREITND